MKLPPQAAVVVVEQRGYSDLVRTHFKKPPTRRSQVLENTAFQKALARRFAERGKAEAERIAASFTQPFEIGSLLDIGAGLGVAPLHLYLRSSGNFMLYLLDGGNAVEPSDKLRVAKNLYSEQHELTFDIGTTRALQTLNGVCEQHLNFLAPNAEAIRNLKQVDMVTSFTSWGWHYPLEVYWEAVQSLFHPAFKLYIDVRAPFDAVLREAFERAEVVMTNEHEMMRMACEFPR